MADGRKGRGRRLLSPLGGLIRPNGGEGHFGRVVDGKPWNSVGHWTPRDVQRRIVAKEKRGNGWPIPPGYLK